MRREKGEGEGARGTVHLNGTIDIYTMSMNGTDKGGQGIHCIAVTPRLSSK